MNWDGIDEWAKERYVNTAIPGLLVHPTKGKYYRVRTWNILANGGSQGRYSLAGSMWSTTKSETSFSWSLERF